MKKAFLLLGFLSLTACSPSEEEKVFSDFDKKYGEEERSCLKQEKLMQESTINDPDDVRFVLDEPAALKTIESIDVKLRTYARYRAHFILLNQHCFHDKKGISYTCPDSLTSYRFFRALTKTATSSTWSKATNEKAIKLVFQYVRQQVSENDGGLLDKGLSLELLKLMAESGILKKDNLPEIKNLSEEVETARQSIKVGRRLGCEDALKHDQKEMKLTEDISAKISPLLSSLPN